MTALKWNTYAWLLLPVLVFMAWWMHWYVSIPLAALMAAGLAPGRRKELPERESLPSFPLFNRSSFLVLGAFIALMVLSGWGNGSISTRTTSSGTPAFVNWSPARGPSFFRTETS
ncbi:hypothetical protein ABFY27_12565 [Akkermansia massiliensis]